MLHIFSFVFLCAISSGLFAEPVRLSWNPPVARENGEIFKPTEVAYYLLSIDYGDIEKIFADNVSKDLPLGAHKYEVSVCDINGLCSAKTVKKFAVKPRPNEPKYPSVRAL